MLSNAARKKVCHSKSLKMDFDVSMTAFDMSQSFSARNTSEYDIIPYVASGKLSGADYEVLAAFRYQIRQFLHFSEEAARKAGLNPQQHQALLALKGLPPGAEPNIGEIAAQLHIRHHSAVELLERLERTGFIRKKRVSGDRRHVKLETTEQGEQVLEKLSLAHRAELESQGPDLIKALDKVITQKSGTNGKKETC